MAVMLSTVLILAEIVLLVCFSSNLSNLCVLCLYECACKGSICQTCHAIQIHPIFPQFGMVVCGARVVLDVIFNNRTSSGFLCLRQHCLKSLASSRLVGNGYATSLVSESNATLRLMFLLIIHVFRMLSFHSFLCTNWQSHGNTKFYTLAETSNFYSTQHVCDVGSSQHVSCDTIAAA